MTITFYKNKSEIGFLIIEFRPIYRVQEMIRWLKQGLYLLAFSQFLHYYKDYFVEESDKDYEWQILFLGFRFFYFKWKN